MDRPRRIALALAAALGTWTATAAGQRQHPIFRDVVVGDGQQTITLGQAVPFATRPLLEADGPRAYHFRPGGYGGADSIRVEVTAGGMVRALVFVYPAGTDFAAMVRDYAGDLGAPVMRQGPGGERAAEWKDGLTSFRVSERGGVVRSSLVDLCNGGCGRGKGMLSAREAPWTDRWREAK